MYLLSQALLLFAFADAVLYLIHVRHRCALSVWLWVRTLAPFGLVMAAYVAYWSRNTFVYISVWLMLVCSLWIFLSVAQRLWGPGAFSSTPGRVTKLLRGLLLLAGFAYIVWQIQGGAMTLKVIDSDIQLRSRRFARVAQSCDKLVSSARRAAEAQMVGMTADAHAGYSNALAAANDVRYEILHMKGFNEFLSGSYSNAFTTYEEILVGRPYDLPAAAYRSSCLAWLGATDRGQDALETWARGGDIDAATSNVIRKLANSFILGDDSPLREAPIEEYWYLHLILIERYIASSDFVLAKKALESLVRDLEYAPASEAFLEEQMLRRRWGKLYKSGHETVP